MKDISNRFDVSKALLVILSIVLVFLGFSILNKTNIADSDIEGLAYMETINSGMQRVAKLELEGNSDNAIIEDLHKTVIELNNNQYFVENPELDAWRMEFVNEFYVFMNSIEAFRVDYNRDNLFLASENNYDKSIVLLNNMQYYINDESLELEQLGIYFIFTVILVAVILVKILLDTIDELNKNKELSEKMFIDTSTGIYNRAKCQEVLKGSVDVNNAKERAIIIIDLNDLKKTNDTLGHRMGDSLIANFATKLRDATKIFDYDVFVGRYGGDEFMIYFDSCKEYEVTDYLAEVNDLVDEFNETPNRQFKMRFAAGYCITTATTKSMLMRELFDNADSNMYENKLLMKAKMKQELEKQNIIEDVIDDRLI